MKGEQLQEWFVKMNPQHTIPTLDDNGKYLWESSVICTYLLDKYANNDQLYPKDLYERAKCNQRLHFTNGILYQRFRNAVMPLFLGAAKIPQEQLEPIEDAYQQAEVLLTKDKYLVGNQLTVADLCAISLINSLNELCLPIVTSKYPKLIEWMGRMKTLPFYEDIEGKYLEKQKQFWKDYMSKSQNK